MIPSPRIPASTAPVLAAAALAATALGALAGPSAAGAAEGFAGVTGGHRLVAFHSDTIPALGAARDIAGLPGGERLVALDAVPGGARPTLLALGVSGTIYAVDRADAQVTGIAGGFGARLLPGTRSATLSVAPDGKSARIIANGRDKTLDLTTRVITSDAQAALPGVAADRGADGVLRGVDPAANTVVSLDAAAPTAHVLQPLNLTTAGATAATTASDGATWILTGLAPRPGGATAAPSQSRLLRYDPATNALRQQSSFLFTTLNAIAATGPVADDATAPRVSVRIPRQTVRDALRHRGFLALVTTSEPGQTVVSARLGTAYRGFGLGTATHDGTLRVVANERLASIRKLAGKRLKLHLAIHDYAGNTKLVDRYFTLHRR